MVWDEYDPKTSEVSSNEWKTSEVSRAPYFFNFAFDEIFTSARSVVDFIVVVFTFLYFDMFNTVGTLIACAGKTGMLK